MSQGIGIGKVYQIFLRAGLYSEVIECSPTTHETRFQSQAGESEIEIFKDL